MPKSVDPPTVTTIGSCRIAGPMRAAMKQGLIRLANSSIYGFVHSAPEALQMARFLLGRIAFPTSLAPYLCANGCFPDRDDGPVPDLYLVEISSLKEIRYGSYFLQSNYFQERLQKLGGLNRLVKANFRADQRDRRAVCLAATRAFSAMSAEERRILVESHLVITSRADMEQTMLDLASVLPAPVAFVTHCNVPNPAGEFLEARAKIVEWAGEIGALHDLNVIDPSTHAETFGVDKALGAGGHDLNHYSPEFEQRLGTLLVDDLMARGSFDRKVLQSMKSATVRDGADFDANNDSGGLRYAVIH